MAFLVRERVLLWYSGTLVPASPLTIPRRDPWQRVLDGQPFTSLVQP